MARKEQFDVTKMNPKDSTIHIEENEKDHLEAEKTEYHPSFGKIYLSSFSGGGSNFFGSDLSHNGGIRLSIGVAHRRRGLSHDWTYCYGDLIEINMSHLQWAEIVSMGMGKGDGTECTINYRHDMGSIVPADLPNKQEIFKSEIDERLDKAVKKGSEIYAKMDEMLKGKTIKKADLKELMKGVTKMQQNIGVNIDFVKKSCHEEMVRMESDAKENIQGYLKHTAKNLGVEALVNKSKLLESEEG